jgi:hypothetical protein
MYLRSIILTAVISAIALPQASSQIDCMSYELRVARHELRNEDCGAWRAYSDSSLHLPWEMLLRELIVPESNIDIAKSVDGFALRPKPWWLRAVTKKWQWVTIDPKIYYPPRLEPTGHLAIIEHEKVHLLQQREMGKYKWMIKYIASKKFRLDQEMEPIAVELANTPPEKRRQLAQTYARDLSGAPYHKAAKTFDLALAHILSKAKEMGIDVEKTE